MIKPTQTQGDIPLPLAIFVLVGFGFVYLYLTYFRLHPAELASLFLQVEAHAQMFWLSCICLTVNFAFFSVFLNRTIGLQRQGSKLAVLKGAKSEFRLGRMEIVSVVCGVFAFFASRKYMSDFLFPLFARVLSVDWMRIAVTISCVNVGVAVALGIRSVLKVTSGIRFKIFDSHTLDKPETEPGDLVLGSTPGELTHSPQEISTVEKWVTMPARGLNGGLMISGSIGSGKTQGTILRYLRQIVQTEGGCPAILAIDPKRTFLLEAEKIIRDAGLGDRIVKISLYGSVSFNPVYMENALRGSKFSELSEMVRAAAVNFMGKSSDSPFWDISSANLIKNAIVYCAAIHGYFTLLDLYRAIVSAAKQSLSEDLKAKLAASDFTKEERFNIECAVEYFENEYTQLEDRVRSGIVATSTAFINQFQEFAANRILCPSKENLTIGSMEELIREGKILLFDINKPGLARSMGTFIKLHYQQAVLNMLTELKDQNKHYTTALIIDEYQDVVTCGGGGTIGDDTFMAKAREAKPAVIVATQSVSSLMDSVGSQRSALVLLQNFRTRIACHSSDSETIKMFQELAGKEDREFESHSLSETAQSAKRNLLAGGFDSTQSSLNESISKATRKEDLVTGRDFSRLRTFEAFAQVFDGVETKFVKLYLKPDFLKFINTKHEVVLEMLRVSKKGGAVDRVKRFSRNLRATVASLFLAGNVQAAIPNICSVASSPAFASCLALQIGSCTCGFPPRPCASITYYVPQTFIEVWPEPRTSYFAGIPGAAAQLSKILPMPFGAEGDNDTQSFQARTIAVPLAGLGFQAMPAGGTRSEKFCFDGMSEHFGAHWNTGKNDMTQPLFLAFSLSPKACLLKGALTSATGEGGGSPAPDSAMCSVNLPRLEMFPPSSHSTCNGWGVFFPRYGTYSGPASMTGALMIASRIKSLSSEVLKSMPNSPDEKWQMIFPQSSSCFREGQNVGILETIKNTRETSRFINGKMKGYLFVVWSRTVTCKDLPSAVQAKAAALAIPSACAGAK